MLKQVNQVKPKKNPTKDSQNKLSASKEVLLYDVYSKWLSFLSERSKWLVLTNDLQNRIESVLSEDKKRANFVVPSESFSCLYMNTRINFNLNAY